MDWNMHPYFAALDWASDHHDVVVIDRLGQVKLAIRFEHSAEGWKQLQDALRDYPNAPIAIETSSGTVVEQLFALGVSVYPVNPKSAQRYRERHAPSAVKDDERDAWSLADALRLDGHGWKPLAPLDPVVAELRLLCRDEIALITQRTALINQLRQALHEYYPAALEAFEDWTITGAWAFIETFPTPAELENAGKRKWLAFLHAHRLWRTDTAEHRLAIFARATAFGGGAPAVAAKSLLAVSLARLLRTLESQLELYRSRIESVFGQHPDHDLFGSLPGAGPKLASRLLAELGDDRDRFSEPQALQSYAGTAPVTIQSGKSSHQKMRHACNDTLRATVHLWADTSRHRCAWAQAYYKAHRAKGQSHSCALRCLGQRWLKILWKMWQSRTSYDEALHMRNQVEHGSWLLTLKAPASMT
jgi:transposase